MTSRSLRHPVNRVLIEEAPLGARIADRVTGFLGSWRFIILQTVLVVAWIGTNIYHLLNVPFDPYPFILLNLAFSTQAAYATPLSLNYAKTTLIKKPKIINSKILELETRIMNALERGG